MFDIFFFSTSLMDSHFSNSTLSSLCWPYRLKLVQLHHRYNHHSNKLPKTIPISSMTNSTSHCQIIQHLTYYSIIIFTQFVNQSRIYLLHPQPLITRFSRFGLFTQNLPFLHHISQLSKPIQNIIIHKLQLKPHTQLITTTTWGLSTLTQLKIYQDKNLYNVILPFEVVLNNLT